MNLTCKLTVDQSAKLAALADAGVRLLPPLVRAWASGTQEVLGRAVKNRFTGKGPFPVSQNRVGIVTNRLRKSMRATGAQIEASSGTITSSMGSNVSYFRGHEFGFSGRVQVRGHTRKAVADQRNTRGRITRKGISDLKVSKIVKGRSNYSLVRPHTRKVNIPARRMVATEIAAPTTKATFYQKINSVLRRVLGFN